VAKDGRRSDLAGAQEARTHAKSDGGGDRKPKCADYLGRRTARLRRGQAQLRPQAAYCDRYEWPSRSSCSSGQRPGLSWRRTAAQEGANEISRLSQVFADRVYRGNQLLDALSDCGLWTIEIVERPQGVKGFQLLPRRWVVERTFAWFGRCRRRQGLRGRLATTEMRR